MSLIRKSTTCRQFEHKSDKVLKTFIVSNAVNLFWPYHDFRKLAYRIYEGLYSAGDIIDDIDFIEDDSDYKEILDESVPDQHLAYKIMRPPLAFRWEFKNFVEYNFDKEKRKNIVERMDSTIAKYEGSLPKFFFGYEYSLTDYNVDIEKFPQLTYREVFSFIRLFVDIAVELITEAAMFWIDYDELDFRFKRVYKEYKNVLVWDEEERGTRDIIIELFEEFVDKDWAALSDFLEEKILEKSRAKNNS